jgi:hypothetical protein
LPKIEIFFTKTGYWRSNANYALRRKYSSVAGRKADHHAKRFGDKQVYRTSPQAFDFIDQAETGGIITIPVRVMLDGHRSLGTLELFQ